jgi:hypothetical protein
MKLALDDLRYNRIKEDLENLIVLEDFKKPPPVQLQQSQQVRKSNRPKPSLFDTVPNPHQNRDLIQGNSNFFNFNN